MYTLDLKCLLVKKRLAVILAVMLILSAVFPAASMAAEGEENAVGSGAVEENTGQEDDKAVNVELEGGDDTAEETIGSLDENDGALLFGGEEDNVLNDPSADKDKAVLNYSRIIYYEDWFTRSFTVKYDGKTRVAYCIEPKDSPPDKSTHSSVKYDKDIMIKALYYSYGYPGYETTMKPYLDNKGLGSDYKGEDGGYVISHLVLSYFYDNKNSGSDAFKGLSSKTKNVVRDVAAALEEEWPEVPQQAYLSVEHSNMKAEWDVENKLQRTPVNTLKGHKDNKVTIGLPEGVTMVKGIGDEWEIFGSGNVDVCGGEQFYFEAPESVQGSFETGKLTGSMESFQPYLIKNSGKQDIIYCGDGDRDSVEFIVEWEDMGLFILNKVSAEPGITDGNENYSLEDAEYSLYDSEGELYQKISTDAGGNAEVVLPEGDYTLKEEKAPKGYAVDNGTHEITVSGEKTVFEHPEEILKKGPDESPQTGDESFPAMAFFVIFAALSVMSGLKTAGNNRNLKS